MPKASSTGKAKSKKVAPAAKRARSAAKKSPSPAKQPPLLKTSDFRAYLIEKAQIIAPEDVATLLTQAAEAHREAQDDAPNHPRLARQIDLALELLQDHVDGECPQIPYHTIATLTVAVLYLLDPIDVIPDWIPNVGLSDDALVMQLALDLVEPGVVRYCTAKGLPMNHLFSKPGVR